MAESRTENENGPAVRTATATVVDPVENQGEVAALIRSRLRDVEDFPKPGVLFKDIVPLLADADAFARSIDALADYARPLAPIDLVAGVEARGFVVAAALAVRMGVGLVPVRKAGKLPPPTMRAEYELEYGTAEIEVPVGLLDGRRVLLVDDVLATGGTLLAAAGLLERAGADLAGIGVLVELSFLDGRAKLDGRQLHALLTL